MPTETQNFSDQTELATTCRLVAGFWLLEVDREKLDLLQAAPVQKAWVELGGIAIPEGLEPAEVLDLLAADYCQLLIGPKEHLPPVQSVWTDHVFQSVAASSAVQFYELYADYRPPGTISDHLGCLLHFAAFLLDQVSHEQAAEQVLVQFRREHLGWVDPLLQRVDAKSDTDFYRGLANITSQLIKELPS